MNADGGSSAGRRVGVEGRVERAMHDLLTRSLPGARLERVVPLVADTAEAGDTHKVAGYGLPLKLEVRLADGASAAFVFHTASPNVFGHQRRADRAEEMLVAFDTFNLVPQHVRAIDVGAVRLDGQGVVSLSDVGEFYLLSEYVAGRIYAEELREVANAGQRSELALERVRQLAQYLAGLHAERLDDASLYRRAVRDLVGSGEGIFGIIDGYPDTAPRAAPERLRAIERRAVEWRWRLRGRSHRLRRTHGDFHPFNIAIAENGRLALLDASRGSAGDPADDVAALAINFVFFALGDARSWHQALRPLWHAFWQDYLEATGDDELLGVVAPFLAWRGLVLANPTWYPELSPEPRDRLLAFVERTLAEERFDIERADEVFA